MRIVGEPMWADRTPDEYPACVQHEALINRAFAGRDLTLLCPYDIAELKPSVLADAERTHPELRDSCGAWPSPRFDPMGVLADYNLPLPAPANAVEFRFNLVLLAAARGFAQIWADRHGLRDPRFGDFALATAELTTNSVLHGGGEGVLRLWRSRARWWWRCPTTGRSPSHWPAGSRRPGQSRRSRSAAGEPAGRPRPRTARRAAPRPGPSSAAEAQTARGMCLPRKLIMLGTTVRLKASPCLPCAVCTTTGLATST